MIRIPHHSGSPCGGRSLSGSGFTLIEVVISVALMSMILVSAYLCLNAGLSSQKLIEPRLEIAQNARVALAMLTSDLRNACPLSTNFDFLGTPRMLGTAQADNLDFATHSYAPARAEEGDYCQVSYFAQENPKTGKLSLWRRRNPVISLDPLSGGKREELITGLRGVRYEYFDGFDWYTSWGEINTAKALSSNRSQPNLSGLPDAVRITLAFDPDQRTKADREKSADTTEDPPLVFQTVVRLELAAGLRGGVTRTTGGGASGGDNGPGNNNGPEMNMQPGQFNPGN